MASKTTPASNEQMWGQPPSPVLSSAARCLTPSSPCSFRLVLNFVSAVSCVIVRQPRVGRRCRTGLCHSALRRCRRRQLPASSLRPSQLCDCRISITLLKRLWNRWCCCFRINRTAHDLLLRKYVWILLLIHVGTAVLGCPS